MNKSLFDCDSKITQTFSNIFFKTRESYQFDRESYLFAGEINALTGELNGSVQPPSSNLGLKYQCFFIELPKNEKPAQEDHADLSNTQRYEKSQRLP